MERVGEVGRPLSLFVLLLILCGGTAEAATRTAASCSQADIQTQITASSDGDTVVIPAGPCTWSGIISIGATETRTKVVQLLATGTGGIIAAAACGNSSVCTVITVNNTTVEAEGSAVACCPGIDVHLNYTLSGLRVAGFWFIQGTDWDSADEEAVWGIRLTGNADSSTSQIRIYNNHIEYGTAHLGTAGNGDDVFGNIVNFGRIGGLGSRSTTLDSAHFYIYGVIDHNVIHGAGSFQCFDVEPFSGRDYTIPGGGPTVNEGNAAGGIQALEGPLSDHLATYKGMFFEDNDIRADHWQDNNACGDGSGGAVQIWRHNIFVNVWLGTHGYETDSSSKWQEVYSNDFVLDEPDDSHFTSPGDIRGGSTVVFSNRYFDGGQKGPYTTIGAGHWDDFGQMIYYRTSVIGDATRGPDPPCKGLMSDFTLHVGCDQRTTTTGAQKGYPGGWQPCTKKGGSQPTWAWGYEWEVEACVAWDNKYGTTTATTVLNPFGTADTAGIIQVRRDYLDYNSCTGHESDPVCIAFWDFGNNKKLGYVSYTYPHPLVGAQAGGSTSGGAFGLRLRGIL